MLKFWRLLIVMSSLLLSVMIVPAQDIQFAVSAQVIGEDSITFMRENAQNSLQLRAGAIFIFGIGDRITTGDNGRVIISLTENDHILLLPNSQYELRTYTQEADSNPQIESWLSGIAIHQFSATSDPLDYTLHTEQYTIQLTNDTEQSFTTWAVNNGLSASTVSSGEITLHYEDNNSILLTDNSGFALPFSDEPVALETPLHASQVIALASNCEGIVTTNGSQGLRLRAGAALDYIVVDVLDDDEMVKIAGTTENGLWYRIPFQTGFGWMYSSLIEADCNNLPVFPNLVNEQPERIHRVSNIELSILEDFYGRPVTNPTFFR